MSKQIFDEERFNGRIVGGDINATYVRTGDLGFLHNVTRPIGPGNQPVEMQNIRPYEEVTVSLDENFAHVCFGILQSPLDH